jgi:hypothetical protein
MALSKVSCPHCHIVLNVSLPPCEAAAFQCPHCQFGFRVQVQVAVAALNEATVAQQDHSSEMVRAQDPCVGGRAEPPPATPASVDLRRPGAVGRGLRIGLVLGGFCLLLALGGVLLGVCLSGAPGSDQDQSAWADLAEQQADVPELKIKTAVSRPLIELSPEDNAVVDDMVQRGVAFLKQAQGEEGSWGANATMRDNYVAFGGLTLLECGVPAADPAIQRAAEFARERCPHINHTYAAALFLLFFDRLNDPRDKECIEELAMRLVAGQSAQGGWSYNVPILTRQHVAALTAFLRAAGKDSLQNMRRSQSELLQALPAKLRHIGPLETPPSPDAEFFRQGGDNSNTQFALLALWAARRHQLPVDHSLDLVVRRFRNSQNEDGSFPYTGHSTASPEPSMTCAGLLGLAVGYGIADKSAAGGPKQDSAIQNALEHLSKSIGRPAPAAQKRVPMTEMYFLWSTERVAVLYQLKTILDKDWYHWGYTMLRKNQKPDGSWFARRGHGSADIPDTCFALLFLQRVNLVKDLTDKLSEMNVAALRRDDVPSGE